MIKNLKSLKKIGKIHLITQSIAFLIITKGVALLFLQVLSESTGWVMLGLWLTFNFLIIPLIVWLVDKNSYSDNSLLLSKSIRILLISLIGGIISFVFYLLYYKFHFFSINKEFMINDFRNDIWNFLVYFSPIIAIGELIRRNTIYVLKIKSYINNLLSNLVKGN